MTEISEKSETYTINAVISIVFAILFILIAVIIPVLGTLDIFNEALYFLRYPDNTRYMWNGVNLATIFRPYDQWAGLTPFPETGYINEIDNAFIIVLLFIWQFPFVLLGIGGTLLYITPVIFYLAKKEPPRYLDSMKPGMLIAIGSIAFEWLLIVFLWFLTLADKGNLGIIPLVGFLLGIFLLYFGEVIWKAKRNWLWEFQRTFSSTVFYIFVIAIIIYCVFPFAWAFILSLQDKAYLGGVVEYLPSHPTIENYTDIFYLYPFHENILNSLILSSFTTVFCVLTGAFGGYVIAQFKFKSKRVILAAILSMTMFPALVILVPLYLEYIFVNDNFNIKMLNTLPGILIPYLTFNLPLTLFLLQNFFEEIPSELIKAARVDGASNFQVFRKVILPLAIPGVFTTGILVFIAAWNEFLFASLLLTRSNWTIPVVMASFEGIGRVQGYVAELLLSAATVIVTLPLIILVLIFQKQIISGITAGAVKG